MEAKNRSQDETRAVPDDRHSELPDDQELCPVCGSSNVSYHGMDDGGGIYGESVCDQWRCEVCNASWEGDCISL